MPKKKKGKKQKKLKVATYNYFCFQHRTKKHRIVFATLWSPCGQFVSIHNHKGQIERISTKTLNERYVPFTRR